MEILYKILYIIAGILVFLALTGGTLTKGLFTSMSKSTLEKAGIYEAKITESDAKLDEALYKVKQVELQIEKIKNFFSSDKIDESKYRKEENNLLKGNIYDPVVEVFAGIYRIIFVFIGIILLLSGLTVYLFYSIIDTRKRLLLLESKYTGI